MYFSAPTSQQLGVAGSNPAPSSDGKQFELSQYSTPGIQHYSAVYRNDPKALERLSKRICARVEQDSSDLITFCDKRIRKRQKKLEEEQKIRNHLSKRNHPQQQQHEEHPQREEPPASAAPECVSGNDLLLGACLGQGSFSSVFVLEKYLHRKPVSGATPRRGRRSKLTRGRESTHQGSSSHHERSKSRRGSSCDPSGNATTEKPRSGRSLRRRLRQRDHHNTDAAVIPSDSHHSTSSRSRSLSLGSMRGLTGGNSNNTYVAVPNADEPPTRQQVPSKHNRSRSVTKPPKSGKPSRESNDSGRSSTRSRSLSRSIQDGLRAVFSPKSNRRKVQSQHSRSINKSHHHTPKSKSYRGARSLSLSKRRGKRSVSVDGTQDSCRTERTHLCDSLNSSDDGSPTQTDRKGVLWKQLEDDADDEQAVGSNLVVKILQPKLMEQPKLFANCAAGLIREGLFLAALDHPHVLKVHGWTSPNGWMNFAQLSAKEGDLYDGYLLVLERLKGGSLKGWMQKWQRENQEEQRAIAAVAAFESSAEVSERDKSMQRRRRIQQALSFTSSSRGGTTTHSTSNHNSSRVRHGLFKGSGSSRHLRSAPEDVSPLASGVAETLGFPGRRYPYTKSWPQNQLADRLSLLLQLSDTVKYLHKHRILHRDLKPDNLGVTFVNEGDTGRLENYPTSLSLKIFDFDIARLVPKEGEVSSMSERKRRLKRTSSSGSVRSLDADGVNKNSHKTSRSCHTRSISPFRSSSSLSGDPDNNNSTRHRRAKFRGQRPGSQGEPLFNMTAKMGSPRYMAPEIARGEPYNLRSEVYTVSLLVHEVLTLEKPYDELPPEHHGRLVHFDIPGYRPPIFPDWNWPSELQEVLHKGWDDITKRPSMREVHTILKRSLPKLCPELAQRPNAPSIVSNVSSSLPSGATQSQPKQQQQQQEPKKGRSLFHRTPIKNKIKRVNRDASATYSITPTASLSEFSIDD